MPSAMWMWPYRPRIRCGASRWALQRAFVSGADEPFARDLVRSFLCVVFPKSGPRLSGNSWTNWERNSAGRVR